MPEYQVGRDDYTISKPLLIASGAAVNVSTLTPLVEWTSVTDFVKALFALQNTDGVNGVSLIVETSEDGVHPDAEFWRAIAPAGDQVSYEIGPKEMRKFYRMSAVTASPGFPTVAVNWQMRGLPLASL